MIDSRRERERFGVIFGGDEALNFSVLGWISDEIEINFSLRWVRGGELNLRC